MLAVCTKAFRDLKEGRYRVVGDTFEVTPERLAEINAAGYGTMAEEVTKAPEEQKPQRRRATRKPKE